MASGRYFFATAGDLVPGLGRFETARQVQYVRIGLFRSHVPETFTSGGTLPELGLAPAGDAIRVPAFLVLSATDPVVVREVRQHSGEMLFAIDQRANPNSTVFRAGGRFQDSVLISGEISTTGTTMEALELHRAMVRIVTKGFRRVNAYWLGPEALAMFEAGARLTKSVDMSSVYDLRTGVT